MKPIYRQTARWRRWLPRLGVGVAALASLWLGAFLRFAADLPREPTAREDKTDGIVVLTGGAVRLDVGIALLAADKARRLLISGVNPATGRFDMKAFAANSELFQCCIDLGFAEDTAGNAREAAIWAQTWGYRSLLIVTASYHMPRSLVEFRRHLATAELHPHPVFPDHVKIDEWWRWPGTAALLISEFNKYLVALVRARVDPQALP